MPYGGQSSSGGILAPLEFGSSVKVEGNSVFPKEDEMRISPCLTAGVVFLFLIDSSVPAG